MNLKQLSLHLGLSPTTVSRAINGYPEVNEETRLRVQAAAKQFNYQPSHHATRLATGKSRAIGQVIPLSEHMMINPHFSDFIAGAGETYSQAGYDMVLSVVKEGEEESVYRNFARDGRVDGIIVNGPRQDDVRINILLEMDLPFVVHGRTMQDEHRYSWLDVNNSRAFERATQFLIELGHRRIALVNGFETMSFAQRRRDGYLRALKAHGIAPDPDIMFSGEMIEPQGYQAIKQLLSVNNPPTAVLTSSMLSALGAHRAMQDSGIKLGVDMSLITFDDQLSFLSNSGDIPLFTSLRSSIQTAGKRLAEMLINQINHPKQAPIQELWDAELVLGNSTSPLKQ